MKAIALIPARGGSKRLSRKNIVDFYGQPIISYTIRAALLSGYFESVNVSTEDKEIAEIAGQYGANVFMRDASMATDMATVKDVCCDFLKHLDNIEQYDILTVLYAAAPLRTSNDIRKVVDLINPNTCHYALATTHYALPPHQALKKSKDDSLEAMWPNLLLSKNNELSKLEVDNGSTYAVYIPAFLKTQSFYGEEGTMRSHLMPANRSVDINTEDDLKLARFYFKNNHLI